MKERRKNTELTELLVMESVTLVNKRGRLSGLDMMNIKTMLTGSSNVCQLRLRELD